MLQKFFLGYNDENVPSIATSFYVGTSLNLLIMVSCIKFWTSLTTGVIRLFTLKLAVHEKKKSILVFDFVYGHSLFVIQLVFVKHIPIDNQDRLKISAEFKFQLDHIIHLSVNNTHI